MNPTEVSKISVASDATQLRRIVILVCLAVSAGSGVAWFLEGSGLQSFPGSIEARTTIVSTSRAAQVESVLVKTGQSVVPGDPLFQLIDSHLKDRLAGKRLEVLENAAESQRVHLMNSGTRKWQTYSSASSYVGPYGWAQSTPTAAVGAAISAEENQAAKTVRFSEWKQIEEGMTVLRRALTEKYQMEF